MAENLEFKILYRIQNKYSPFWDNFAVILDALFKYGALLIVITAVFLYFKKTRRIGESMMISLILSLVVCNMFLKPLIGRTRPFVLDPYVYMLISPPTDGSFPSGHTYSTFAWATALFLHKRIWGLLALFVAFGVGLSRLYLFVHYPSDVAAGAVLGILTAVISEKLILLTEKSKK